MSQVENLREINKISDMKEFLAANEQIKMASYDDDLCILQYDKELSFSDKVPLVHYKGAIYNSEGNKVIPPLIGVTKLVESDPIDMNWLETSFGEEGWRNCKIYPSVEGTIVRVFNYKSNREEIRQLDENFRGKWYITTEGKLDAFKSFYPNNLSLSHGEELCRCLRKIYQLEDEVENPELIDIFTNNLDDRYVYTFLLTNTGDKRFVCRHELTMFLINVFDPTGVAILQNLFNELTYKVRVPMPQAFPITNREEFCQYLKGLDPFEYQGLFISDGDRYNIKVYSDRYCKYLEVRGTMPSIKNAYYSMRSSPENIEIFKELYPEKIERFDMYEERLKRTENLIVDVYFIREVRREFVFIYKPIHSLYEEFLKALKEEKSHDISFCASRTNLLAIANRVLCKANPKGLNILLQDNEDIFKIANHPFNPNQPKNTGSVSVDKGRTDKDIDNRSHAHPRQQRKPPSIFYDKGFSRGVDSRFPTRQVYDKECNKKTLSNTFDFNLLLKQNQTDAKSLAPKVQGMNKIVDARELERHTTSPQIYRIATPKESKKVTSRRWLVKPNRGETLLGKSES